MKDKKKQKKNEGFKVSLNLPKFLSKVKWRHVEFVVVVVLIVGLTAAFFSDVKSPSQDVEKKNTMQGNQDSLKNDIGSHLIAYISGDKYKYILDNKKYVISEMKFRSADIDYYPEALIGDELVFYSSGVGGYYPMRSYNVKSKEMTKFKRGYKYGIDQLPINTKAMYVEEGGVFTHKMESYEKDEIPGTIFFYIQPTVFDPVNRETYNKVYQYIKEIGASTYSDAEVEKKGYKENSWYPLYTIKHGSICNRDALEILELSCKEFEEKYFSEGFLLQNIYDKEKGQYSVDYLSDYRVMSNSDGTSFFTISKSFQQEVLNQFLDSLMDIQRRYMYAPSNSRSLTENEKKVLKTFQSVETFQLTVYNNRFRTEEIIPQVTKAIWLSEEELLYLDKVSNKLCTWNIFSGRRCLRNADDEIDSLSLVPQELGNLVKIEYPSYEICLNPANNLLSNCKNEVTIDLLNRRKLYIELNVDGYSFKQKASIGSIDSLFGEGEVLEREIRNVKVFEYKR